MKPKLTKTFWIIFLIGIFYCLFIASGTIPQERRVSCILATDENGAWYVLEDEYHDNNGCGDVSQTSTYVKVEYSDFTKIVSNTIEEDNQLNDRLIDAGGSLGRNRTLIYFHQNGALINPNTMDGVYDNVFFEIIGNDYE